jgi:hypothetical protein
VHSHLSARVAAHEQLACLVKPKADRADTRPGAARQVRRLHEHLVAARGLPRRHGLRACEGHPARTNECEQAGCSHGRDGPDDGVSRRRGTVEAAVKRHEGIARPARGQAVGDVLAMRTMVELEVEGNRVRLETASASPLWVPIPAKKRLTWKLSRGGLLFARLRHHASPRSDSSKRLNCAPVLRFVYCGSPAGSAFGFHSVVQSGKPK